MTVLIKKISRLGLLHLQLIAGIIIAALAVIGLPASVMVGDITLMANPFVLGTVLFGMAMFSAVGYFGFIRYYVLYRKTPEVQMESDGEFLYVHGKKEAKIPLADLKGAEVRVDLPHLFSQEFFRVYVIHRFTEEYGDVYLKVPEYGTYRMRFVPKAELAATELQSFITGALISTQLS